MARIDSLKVNVYKLGVDGKSEVLEGDMPFTEATCEYIAHHNGMRAVTPLTVALELSQGGVVVGGPSYNRRVYRLQERPKVQPFGGTHSHNLELTTEEVVRLFYALRGRIIQIRKTLKEPNRCGDLDSSYRTMLHCYKGIEGKILAIGVLIDEVPIVDDPIDNG